MRGADLVCAEESKEGSVSGRCLDSRPAVGFFALHNADDRGDDHSGFACCLNCGDGGGAGRADVVDDDDACALAAEAFDAPAGTMGLLCFADEKAMEEWCAGMLLRAPRAGCGNVGDDRVRSHGKPADRFSLDVVLLEEFEDRVAGEAAALCVQRGGAAIDVVVAGAAGRKLELAELEAGAGEEREELPGVR